METKNVQLPRDIVESVENRIAKTNFETPSEYIAHVMDDVLYELETGTEGDDPSRVDEREVRERLESLGYLNE